MRGHDVPHAIAVDDQNYLWVATTGLTLYRLDGEREVLDPEDKGILWRADLGDPIFHVEPFLLAVTDDGRATVGARLHGALGSFFIARFDEDGVFAWRFDPPGRRGELRDRVVDADSGDAAVITHRIESESSLDIVRLDAVDGQALWTRSYESNARIQSAATITIDARGRIVAGGSLDSKACTIVIQDSEDRIEFVRGDCNDDGAGPGQVNDANGDGRVFGQVTDAIYLLQHGFLGGAPPPPPYPDCGVGGAGEHDGDAALGCVSHAACAGR